MSAYDPNWFSGAVVQNERIVSLPLVVPDICPSTLVLLSQNMVRGMFVAGGSCITIFDPMHQFDDIDVYVNSDSAENHLVNLLSYWGFKETAKPYTGITQYSDDVHVVQVIKSEGLKNIRDLISTFDIEACKVGFDDVEIVCGPNTQRDIVCKEISMINPVYPNVPKLLGRFMKYARKGYRTAPNLIKEVWEKNQKTPLTSAEQLRQEMLESMRQLQQSYPMMPLQPAYPAPAPYNPAPVNWPTYTGTSVPVTISYNCAKCGMPFPSNGAAHICY